MTPDQQYQLAQLLSLAGLMACTIQYAVIVQRRVEQRRLEVERATAHLAGLQGLVRVFLDEG